MALSSRGEHRSPAKKHKDTFLLWYFSMTKSTKSHQRERSPLFDISSRVHELVARSSAWRVRAAKGKVQVGGFATLRNFNYTTRANISHEIVEQIRARIACTPAESARRAWGSLCMDGMGLYFLFFFCWLYLSFSRGRRLDDPLLSRGEHRSPAKKHKDTFPLSYFCVTKRRVQGGEATSERRRRDGVYQKSARRTHAVLLPNHRGVHELVARSSAWQVHAAKDKAKVGSFTAPHDFSHTTRANTSHEKTEQIRARIACTPAEIARRA